MPTIYLLRILWSHLGFRRQKQVLFLLVAMIASAFAELVSLGTVVPLLTLIANPDKYLDNNYVRGLLIQIGVANSAWLIVILSLLFGVTVLISSIVRLATIRSTLNLSASIGSDLASRVFESSIRQPYLEFIKQNSSSLITAITAHVSGTVVAITAALQLITSALISIFIFCGLLIIAWKVALVSIAYFGAAYYLLASSVKGRLYLNSLLIADRAVLQIQCLREAIGSYRDIILDQSHPVHTESFLTIDRSYRQRIASNQFLASFPRYYFESLGILLFAFIASYMTLSGLSTSSIIPILGSLAFGAQRLLPSMQLSYSGWSTIKSQSADIVGVATLLERPTEPQFVSTRPYVLKKKISFRQVCLKYSTDLPEVLSGASFDIAVGEKVGIIGSSGSGKSTVIDMLMGLLPPSSGKILVDGADIFDSSNFNLLCAWRSSIAHVPQMIYIANRTLAENIALGLRFDEIDMEKVRCAAKRANILEFVESIPDGFKAVVGESGIQLSGGQRQRLGIARALYREAKVIVLDEATSALDNHTEKHVMKEIQQLGREVTIVMVAHRSAPLEGCDRLISIQDGCALELSSRTAPPLV